MNLQIIFKFKDCKLQFYEKRRFSYFSVNPRTLASRWRRLLRLSLASFSPHHYSKQQRSPFRLFITRQKLSNALKSLKSKKVYRNRPIERTSERVPFSISYLQLALTHPRNSRVKKWKKEVKLLSNSLEP